MLLKNICPPAILYIVFTLTHIMIDMFKNLYNLAFIKFMVMIIFTILLNFLCKKGLSIVSWFIVFIPFIMMTIITSLVLFTFGLSPSQGSLDYNVKYPGSGKMTRFGQGGHGQRKYGSNRYRGQGYWGQGYGGRGYNDKGGGQGYMDPSDDGEQGYSSQSDDGQGYGGQGYSSQSDDGQDGGRSAVARRRRRWRMRKGTAGQDYNGQEDQAGSGQDYSGQEGQAGSGKDYSGQDYGAQDYGAQDYGAQDYGAQDYGAQDYGAQEYTGPSDGQGYRDQEYRDQGYQGQDYQGQDYDSESDVEKGYNNPAEEWDRNTNRGCPGPATDGFKWKNRKGRQNAKTKCPYTGGCTQMVDGGQCANPNCECVSTNGRNTNKTPESCNLKKGDNGGPIALSSCNEGSYNSGCGVATSTGDVFSAPRGPYHDEMTKMNLCCTRAQCKKAGFTLPAPTPAPEKKSSDKVGKHPCVLPRTRSTQPHTACISAVAAAGNNGPHRAKIAECSKNFSNIKAYTKCLHMADGTTG